MLMNWTWKKEKRSKYRQPQVTIPCWTPHLDYLNLFTFFSEPLLLFSPIRCTILFLFVQLSIFPYIYLHFNKFALLWGRCWCGNVCFARCCWQVQMTHMVSDCTQITLKFSNVKNVFIKVSQLENGILQLFHALPQQRDWNQFGSKEIMSLWWLLVELSTRL